MFTGTNGCWFRSEANRCHSVRAPAHFEVDSREARKRRWSQRLEFSSGLLCLPERTAAGSDRKQIGVIPYVLPHISKLTAERHERGAGLKGWNFHQGFYVYRNERLLVQIGSK